jgi:hypothetical protein
MPSQTGEGESLQGAAGTDENGSYANGGVFCE